MIMMLRLAVCKDTMMRCIYTFKNLLFPLFVTEKKGALTLSDNENIGAKRRDSFT